MKRAAVDSALIELNDEKRRKSEQGEVVVANVQGSKSGQVVRARTSDLEAPIMLLTGHQSEIFTMKFSPQGNILASGGHDKLIYIWNVYGNCANLHRLKGHKNAILDLHWNRDGSQLYAASADCSVSMWDTETWTRVKKMPASEEIVNTCCPSRRGADLLVSGGDDSFARLWDLRAPKRAVQNYEGAYPVLSVALSDTSDQVFVGDVSGEIQVWESRKEEVLYTLAGHSDRVTGMSLSPDGSYVLSNSADNTVRCWDVRPFVAGGDDQRCVKLFLGHKHGPDANLLKCSWHPSGKMVSAGSSDTPPHVYVWNTASRKVEYKLPGHKATVNEIDFHPSGNIIGSCSSDKTIYLGEIQAD